MPRKSKPKEGATAVLTFHLPADEDALARALAADRLFGVVWTVQNHFLRNKLKYGHQYNDADEALEDVQREISQQLQEAGIDMDQLYS